jgi:hypothetical protein
VTQDENGAPRARAVQAIVLFRGRCDLLSDQNDGATAATTRRRGAFKAFSESV